MAWAPRGCILRWRIKNKFVVVTIQCVSRLVSVIEQHTYLKGTDIVEMSLMTVLLCMSTMPLDATRRLVIVMGCSACCLSRNNWFLGVSELDSPVVQPLHLAKRRKIQEMSTPASKSEHRLDPRSLERSFNNAATSALNPKRSPLDYVKAELAENIQLKKALLSSAKEELHKATREHDALTPLSAIRSRLCGNCHKSGHTRPKCSSSPCPSHEACGLRDKHPELKQKISELQKEIKRLQQEHSDAESKLKGFCESHAKASTSFFAVMRPRVKVRNLIKESDRISLDRDLLILQKGLNGKVPEFDASEDCQLPILIEQYRNGSVDTYFNSAAILH